MLAVRTAGLKFDNAVILEGQTVLKALAAEKALEEAMSVANKTHDAENLLAKLGEAEAAGLDAKNQVVQAAKKAIKAIESVALQISAAEKRLKAAFIQVGFRQPGRTCSNIWPD